MDKDSVQHQTNYMFYSLRALFSDRDKIREHMVIHESEYVTREMVAFRVDLMLGLMDQIEAHLKGDTENV